MQLVFKLIDAKPSEPEKRNESVPFVKMEEIGEPVFETAHDFDQIKSRLDRFATISRFSLDLGSQFSILFTTFFWNETPHYELSPGVFGATRSNWTYHTALAISQTCRTLNFTCKFEAFGKRDAIIESQGEVPVMILAAEWEWDYDDIFGTGKELDKLRITCQNNPSANAFLLIYCPRERYLDHLEKIVEFWITETRNEEQPLSLFLHTVIFEENKNTRQFLRLARVEIGSTGIIIWDDLDLDA